MHCPRLHHASKTWSCTDASFQATSRTGNPADARMHTSRIQHASIESIVLLVQGRTAQGYIKHLRHGDARMHTSRLHHALEILVMQRCIAPGYITRLKPGDARMQTSRPHLALEFLLMHGCILPGYSAHLLSCWCKDAPSQVTSGI